MVWHTQGSGKSLTMVFLARMLRASADLAWALPTRVSVAALPVWAAVAWEPRVWVAEVEDAGGAPAEMKP